MTIKLATKILPIFVFGLVGCRALSPVPERAIVEPKIVKSAIELEKLLNGRKDVSAPDGRRWFEVTEGRIPVIITAPHATRPMREGNRRFSDGGATAALAVAIGKLTGATVLYTTYEGPTDPNYYDGGEFKEELGRLIAKTKPRLVLDIHGSHPFRSYDIDIGTMGGASLLGKKELLFVLISKLNAEGIFSISYNRFAASGNQTIAKYASRKGIPAIQLEINATYVKPSAGDIEAQRFAKLLQALVRFIESSQNLR